MEATPQTQAEADRVDLVYQYVLAQIGAKTASEVLTLWQDVPVGQAANAAAQWLGKAANSILTRRFQSKELGIAYYRLVRALRTGSTIASPLNEEEEPKRVSLEMLRQEFEALVAEHTGEGSTEVTADPEPDGDEDAVQVEALNDLFASLEDDDKASEDYAHTLLTEMAEHAAGKVEGLPEGMNLKEARAIARKLHGQSGAMIAAAGARTAMNGGRNATNQASARDKRVIGWVRQSSTGTPCYWCAMLISRRVLYRSEFTAGDGLFKFHDNCKCVAEPIYSDKDFKSNPKYAENRKYAALWDAHIKDKFSGDDALNEWRKLIARIRANEKRKAAPEAA